MWEQWYKDGVPQRDLSDVPTYQWFRDGEPLPGQNCPSLRIEDVDFAESGSYYVVVMTPAGPLTSSTTNVTITRTRARMLQPAAADARHNLSLTAVLFPQPTARS